LIPYAILKFGKLQKISLFISFQEKQENGILVLSYFTLSASFSKIGPEKWSSALMG
jgi:hypothetical protein